MINGKTITVKVMLKKQFTMVQCLMEKQLIWKQFHNDQMTYDKRVRAKTMLQWPND